MSLPKVRLFPLVYWFVNLTLTDNHDTKNLWGLIRPWKVWMTDRFRLAKYQGDAKF